ncbi:uncharacterized protein PRCAT00003532001 [Priceomyces carsonii]|uniref:uncharacterized protein n=1 Tax=Priceomyces carsonii TaxID=28549 RepID=UPI002ED877EF|nr:unnamed protein product [Priceomyces carsonii]
MGISRKPGFIERYYICRNVERYYTNLSIIVEIDKIVDADLISNALRNMVLKNPWFTLNFYRIDDSILDSESNGHNFEVRPVKHIKFTDVVKFETITSSVDEDLLEGINKLNCPMNELCLPLWRIIVYQNEEQPAKQYICFYCDHSLFDGVAALEFQKDLLKEISDVYCSKSTAFQEFLFELEADVDPDHYEVPQARENEFDLYETPLTEASNSRVSNSLVFKKNENMTGINEANGKKILEKSKLFNYPTVSTNTNSRYRTSSFEPEIVGKMLKFCKSQGITLTSYFDIICLQCLQETVFKDIKSKDDDEFSTSTLLAVNGRRYYDTSKFVYGTMAAALEMNFGPMPPIEDANITLDLMKATHKEVGDSITTRECFLARSQHKELNNWSYFSAYLKGSKIKTTCVFSNLGVFHEHPNCHWRAKDIWFSLNTSIMYNFIFNLVSLQEGRLKLVFVFRQEYEEVMSEKETKSVDNLMKLLETKLADFCS